MQFLENKAAKCSGHCVCRKRLTLWFCLFSMLHSRTSLQCSGKHASAARTSPLPAMISPLRQACVPGHYTDNVHPLKCPTRFPLMKLNSSNWYCSTQSGTVGGHCVQDQNPPDCKILCRLAESGITLQSHYQFNNGWKIYIFILHDLSLLCFW